MTNKELFIKIANHAQKEEKAIRRLEHVLGNIVIENDLVSCLGFCDEICAHLVFGEEAPDIFYDDFWTFIFDGKCEYIVNDEVVVCYTPEDFWSFWKEKAYGA